MTQTPGAETASQRFLSGRERAGWHGLRPALSASSRRRRNLLGKMCRRVALLALVVASPMRAAEPGPGYLFFESERLRFRGGEVVKLRWAPLPHETEEFELLLSLDGGHHFIRLTEMQEPSLESLEWRVPNLPSGDARLCLRVGLKGKEVELELSAPFTILGDGDAPIAGVTFRAGEWWTSQTIPVALPDVQAPHQHAGSPVPPDWGAHLAPSLGRDHIATAPPAVASTARSACARPDPREKPRLLGRSPRIIPLRE